MPVVAEEQVFVMVSALDQGVLSHNILVDIATGMLRDSALSMSECCGRQVRFAKVLKNLTGSVPFSLTSVFAAMALTRPMPTMRVVLDLAETEQTEEHLMALDLIASEIVRTEKRLWHLDELTRYYRAFYGMQHLMATQGISGCWALTLSTLAASHGGALAWPIAEVALENRLFINSVQACIMHSMGY